MGFNSAFKGLSVMARSASLDHDLIIFNILICEELTNGRTGYL